MPGVPLFLMPNASVNAALNSGFALVDAVGATFFVFQAGPPVIRKYAADGSLLFERQIQGREIDELLPKLPSSWPRDPQQGELPGVRPTIRTTSRCGPVMPCADSSRFEMVCRPWSTAQSCFMNSRTGPRSAASSPAPSARPALAVSVRVPKVVTG